MKETRREMLRRCGCGFGSLALASMFAGLARTAEAARKGPLAARDPHFEPRAKRVIFLFMHGGPSHVDTFDPKPALARDEGKSLPRGFVKGAAFDESAKLLPSPFAFRAHGQSGLEISEIFPEVGKHADELCVIRGMHTNGQDHTQAVLKLHTGSENQPRPSVGSWVLYGLGAENQNLPGFITISPSAITGGVQNYGSSFLPAVYQGTPLGQARGALNEAQIRHIANGELPMALQRQQLDFAQELNRRHLARSAEPDPIEGVIESYELAFRMQMEAPEVTDLSKETPETLARYGVDQTATNDFARQCLLARRFAEKGVRFIQVNHAFKWDSHQNLKAEHERNAREVDQPIGALLGDLKERGLLKDTLVLWGGEFGRTPTGQRGGAAGREAGRDHNPFGFSIWLAGGGAKAGMSYGETDEYGYQAVNNKVHMHDLHATMLHLLGLDHEKLTFRHAGRDFRLTDVHGNVVKAILA